MNRTRLTRRTVIAACIAVATTAPATTAYALPTGVPTASSTADRGGSGRGVIVWTSRTHDGIDHLLIARADGSRQRQLTAAIPGAGDIDAQVSPRGDWVAYEHDVGETGTIRLVRPSGADDHVIDVGCVDPCVAALSPTWLSDDRLAFTLVDGPFPGGIATSAVLFTARRDGSHVRRLSSAGIDGTYEDQYARTSRDGSYLTFLRARPADGTRALFRSAPDGSHVRQLTPWHIGAEAFDLSTAAKGPTKDLIVFEAYGRGDPDATFVDLATVPATCHPLADCAARIRWLTDNGASGRRNANPQWSPDGSSLVFTDRSSIEDPNPDIWTMRYDRIHRHQVSTSPDYDYRPAWGR